MVRSETCEALLFIVGVMSAYLAFSIPEMRIWFAAWAVILEATAISLFVYRKK